MKAKLDGGRVAAFFDLDGTLVPAPSLEWRFFSALRKSRSIPFSNYLRWMGEALRLMPDGLLAAQHRNKRYLKGVYCDWVVRHMGSIGFFDQGIARVAWHAWQGHRIFLVSGTLEALAGLAATALECDLGSEGVHIRPRVCATRLAEVRGQWTGEISGEALYGRAKAYSVKAVGAEEKIDLRECHAYGNSVLDRHFLCAVGHGHAVNPGKQLTALAKQKNWTIWRWLQEKQFTSRKNTDVPEEIHHNEGTA
jgi:HAD superfamily phosphoserine phosphatase-like hydrolase